MTYPFPNSKTQQSSSISECLLNEQEVSDLIKIKLKTLQAWRVRGGGPKFLKLGRCVRYRPGDLQEFIEKQTRNSTSDVGLGNNDAAQ